jgi:tetratricopeptide (TPR) repeat protein
VEKPFSAYQGDGPYIFVCYAHDDAGLVYPEIRRLEESGFHLWYDEGISPGSEWSASLAEHIERCAIFLFFVTPRSVEREHCRREVNFALDQNRSILAVHLEETQLPSALKLSLNHRQAVLKHDYQQKEYEQRLHKALTDINPIDSGSGYNSSERSDTGSQDSGASGRNNRTTLILILAFMFAFSGLFGWYLESGDTDDDMVVPTIAIAPIETLSGDKTLAMFTEGIVVDLAHSLSRESTEGTRLIQNPETADFVLRGRYQPDGIDARFVFQLIRSSDGAVLWSKVLTETYDPEGTPDFTHAEYLATMINVVVFLETNSELGTNSPEARTQYIMGLVEWLEIAQGFDGDLGASLIHFQRAIELDAQFADPVRQLGVHYRNRLLLSLPYQDVVEKAHQYAQRVIELQPNDTFLLGTINTTLDLDYPAALANLENARRHGWPIGEVEFEIGQLLLAQGKVETAVQHLETAIRVGAITNRAIAKFFISRAYLAAGRYQKSKAAAIEAVSLSRGTELFHLSSLGQKLRACYYTGDLAAANETLDFAWEAYGSERPEFFPGDLALLGRTDLALRVLEASEDRYQRGELPLASESFWGHFYLGNLEEAMIWLVRAIENRESWLFPMLRRSELLDEVRDDPRFKQAMNRLAEIEAMGTPTRSIAYP